jgi:uncharacterized phiE125 gp8 family phage protein
VTYPNSSGLRVITAVATEPVTLTQAKLHLKVDDTADNDLITALITMAREMAEHYTSTALAPQTLELALDDFPHDGTHDAIRLPRGPATSITSVKYTDTDGAEQTITGTAYALSLYGKATDLAPTYGNEWPSTQDVPDAVRVRYVAGPTTAPKAAYAAMLILIAHLYEQRGGEDARTAAEMPTAARALLDTIRDFSR